MNSKGCYTQLATRVQNPNWTSNNINNLYDSIIIM